MIQNYIKTALRIMLRNKAYSAINIAGLSIGIAASLIIIIYITDEVSYDNMHRDAKHIYRVGFSGRLQGNSVTSANSPAPLAEVMQKEIPQVAATVRFGLWRTMPMGVGDKNFTEKHVLVADSNFFQFFSFPVLQGNPETFLKGPNKLVITESAAKRYFGNEDPIGKLMMRGRNGPLQKLSVSYRIHPIIHILFSIWFCQGNHGTIWKATSGHPIIFTPISSYSRARMKERLRRTLIGWWKRTWAPSWRNSSG